MKNKLSTFALSNISIFKEYLSDRKNLYFFLIFIVALFVHFYASLIGWNNSLLDQHGFRQTQTAITTFYTIKEGFRLNYITPVLGAPWSIPFEFPLFQWIVALLVIVLKTPIDQTGRFVSLLFFYFSLIPSYAILKSYLNKTNYALIILSLILLNPVYLFWSRTFMIESLALFLGITFCWLAMRLFQTKKSNLLIFALVAGSLAALVKVTTFIVLCTPIGCLFLYQLFKEYKNDLLSLKSIRKYILYGIVLFAIPFGICSLWTHYADVQKSANPIAGFITSSALTSWNFGTLHQKLNPSTWTTIEANSLIPRKIFGTLTAGAYTIPVFFVILLLFLIFSRDYRSKIFLSLICFMAGPIIFTNLYYIHNYYYYANDLFISIIIGLFIIASIERSNKVGPFIAFVALPLILFMSFNIYRQGLYPFQVKNNDSLVASTDAIKRNTKPDDVILIIGQDWDSSFPYYAERKAIMDRTNVALSDASMQKSIDNTGKISALVVSNITDKSFIDQQVNYLKFDKTPVYRDNLTSIYLPI